MLANGIVYITWSSHCDLTPYHGWVIRLQHHQFAGSAAGLQCLAEWQPGGHLDEQPGAAGGHQRERSLSTGNGSVDAVNHGESFLKLTPSGANLNQASFFTPTNWSSLNSGQDISCGGLLMIPNTSLILSGQGRARSLSTGTVGRTTSTTNDSVGMEPRIALIHGDRGGTAIARSPTLAASSDHLTIDSIRTVIVHHDCLCPARPPRRGPARRHPGSSGDRSQPGMAFSEFINTTSNARSMTVAGTLPGAGALNMTMNSNSDMIKPEILSKLPASVSRPWRKRKCPWPRFPAHLEHVQLAGLIATRVSSTRPASASIK